MNTHADDSFGNLVSVANPYGFTTTVYTRVNGKLAKFFVGSGDHQEAITEVRMSLGDVRRSRTGRWKNGPVLAVVGSHA